MQNPWKSSVALLFLAALLVLPSTAAADIEGKGGFFDAKFEVSRKPELRTVQWLWWPHYRVGSVPYVLYASCSRFDENDEPVGTNKIRFRNVTLRGVDTDTVVSFRNRKLRLRNGEHDIVTWDANAAQTIATETAVIGRAQIQVKGKLAAENFLRCEFGTAELTGDDAVALGGD